MTPLTLLQRGGCGVRRDFLPGVRGCCTCSRGIISVMLAYLNRILLGF